MSANQKAIKAQEKAREEKLKERDDKCIPVVEKIFDKIVEVRPTLRMNEKEEAMGEYSSCSSEILKIMLEADLTMSEFGYVTRLCSSRIELLMKTVEHGMEVNKMDMHEKVYGKPVEMMTMKEVDDYLTKNVDEEQVEEVVPAE